MTNIHCILRLIIIIFFINLSCIYSQVNDFESWSCIEIKKKITKKIEFIFEEELRLNDNSTKIKKIYSDIGLSYSFNKHIKLVGYYRFIKKRKYDSYYSNRHRLYADIFLKNKFNRLTIAYRTRYQAKYVDIYSSEDGFIPRKYNRNKLSLKYDIKKNPISPYCSFEAYYQLNNPEGNEFDKIRYTCGIDYKFNKRNSLDIYYRLQKQININNPVNSYILGLKYCYSIK
ncbi:MAG: DUF2490 domain-containing protein [Bacteroidales bacterium]|nr:DUF2490 domain-containing protein [Bacteroidales bacterium]